MGSKGVASLFLPSRQALFPDTPAVADVSKPREEYEIPLNH